MNPDSPKARLPASAGPSPAPARRRNRKPNTSARNSFSASSAPRAPGSDSGQVSTASGCNACACGSASSGIPAPENEFHSGHSPAPTARRTAALQGANWVNGSHCKRFTGHGLAGSPRNGATPVSISSASGTPPPASIGPSSSPTTSPNTHHTRRGTASHHRASAHASPATSVPTHSAGSRSAGVQPITGPIPRGAASTPR
jgi:hypothetical protein